MEYIVNCCYPNDSESVPANALAINFDFSAGIAISKDMSSSDQKSGIASISAS